LVLAGAFGIPVSVERDVLRGSTMISSERVMVVSYRFSTVTIVLSLTIRLKSTGVGHFGTKFGEDVSQILMQFGRDMGLSYAKEIVWIFYVV